MKKLLVITFALIMILSSYAQAFAVDSYSEYFSEEREFVVGDNTYMFSTYFFSNSNDNDYLYSKNIDTGETALVFAQPVTKSFMWDEYIYCVVNDTNIIRISITGQNSLPILNGDKEITQLYANNDLIFYSTDSAIYRYHINSQTNDKIIESENIGFFYPYSNYTIEWGINDKQTIYRYNSNTNITVELNDSSFANRFDSSIAVAARASTYNVHGTILPFSSGKLGLNNYYNSMVTTSCDGHHSAGACPYVTRFDSPNYCTICCSYSDPAGGYGYQCHGYGLEIFDNIFGQYPSKTNTALGSIDSTAAAKDFLWSLSSGTLVRGKRNSYFHTFVICDITTNDITIVESNIKGSCKNSKETLTFSEFNRYYSNISYTYKGLHTFGTNYSYDSDCHWQQCTKLNCNGKTNIGYHNFQQNNHGISVCTICNCPDPSSANSTEYEIQ